MRRVNEASGCSSGIDSTTCIANDDAIPRLDYFSGKSSGASQIAGATSIGGSHNQGMRVEVEPHGAMPTSVWIPRTVSASALCCAQASHSYLQEARLSGKSGSSARGCPALFSSRGFLEHSFNHGVGRNATGCKSHRIRDRRFVHVHHIVRPGGNGSIVCNFTRSKSIKNQLAASPLFLARFLCPRTTSCSD